MDELLLWLMNRNHGTGTCPGCQRPAPSSLSTPRVHTAFDGILTGSTEQSGRAYAFEHQVFSVADCAIADIIPVPEAPITAMTGGPAGPASLHPTAFAPRPPAVIGGSGIV